MRPIFDIVLIGPKERFPRFVRWNGWVGRPVHRLDQVTLGTAHPVDGGISGLHLRDEHRSLVNEFVDVRSMASETERLIFVPRESQVLVQRCPEGGRVNGSGER